MEVVVAVVVVAAVLAGEAVGPRPGRSQCEAGLVCGSSGLGRCR